MEPMWYKFTGLLWHKVTRQGNDLGVGLGRPQASFTPSQHQTLQAKPEDWYSILAGKYSKEKQVLST